MFIRLHIVGGWLNPGPGTSEAPQLLIGILLIDRDTIDWSIDRDGLVYKRIWILSIDRDIMDCLLMINWMVIRTKLAIINKYWSNLISKFLRL